MKTVLPRDSTSLLVPVHLDAWVVDSQNQAQVAWYYPDFSKLAQFESPIPAPFDVSSATRPVVGVHLHWALPDALTHGGEPATGGQFQFPFVPNRWLITRFNVPVIGTTGAVLAGASVISILLLAGASEPLAVGMPLQIVSPDGHTTALVKVASAVAQGGTKISIQAYNFTASLPAGSTIRRVSANNSMVPPADMPWQCKLWVVQSDYLATSVGSVGLTAGTLNGSGVTTIPLQGGGAGIPIALDTFLEVITPDEKYSTTVTTAAAVKVGDPQIAIQSYDFTTGFPAGSTLQLPGSAFLDPTRPSSLAVAPGQTTFDINYATLGTSYDIKAWETTNDPGTGQPFLQAVGPGNVSFAAYVPFVKNVFNFTDTDLPPEGTGVYSYTYMVVGWYSAPQTADPLRGVATYPQGAAAYVPPIWASKTEWQAQIPTARFQAILDYMRWSVEGNPGALPPSTSLYHGLVSGVKWPYHTLGGAVIQSQNIRVAVGNTATDALAALIQAEAQQEASLNPNQSTAWITAGNNLSELIRAAMFDLLDDYSTPGGSVLVEQQLEQTWYGSNPGDTVWEVVSALPQVATPSGLTPGQAAALNKQLAALNRQQRDLNQARRLLQSLQPDLYRMWLKYGLANMQYSWGQTPQTTPDWSHLSTFTSTQIYPELFNQVWDQYCAVRGQQAKLPDPTDNAAATRWAHKNWSFPAPGGGVVTLSDLGLKLKANAIAPFWHPNDPVMLVAGLNRSHRHGEDGRYNRDGTLTCRLPGQVISGIHIPGQPTISLQALITAGISLNPYRAYTAIPGVPSLVQEAFFVDSGNAIVMATALNGDARIIEQAIKDLLKPKLFSNTSKGKAKQGATQSKWSGQAPAPFAMAEWTQAWAPLFLEWELDYFPTGSAGQFSPGDWSFDGTHYTWNGIGLNPNYYAGYKGRTLLTPQAPLHFKNKIQHYLQANSNMDSQQIETLINTVAGWDLLSQSLGGLIDQFVTLLPQETFPPPQGGVANVPCPRPLTGGTPPGVAALIGDQYNFMPVLEAQDTSYFFPVRSGFVQIQQLQVVDAFGQSFGGPVNNPNSGWPLTSQGFQPLLGQGLVPAITPGKTWPSNFPHGAFQLSPCLIQSARLDLRFLANDNSGQDILISDNPNPVCGWLLPNHLDGSIAVYDAGGVMLGELLPLPQPDNWRPRPGPPGNNPTPQQPGHIANTVLRAVITSIAAQATEVFNDLLSVIDETLWMVDPLGGRKDQFLSVLIGRPLAVVQANLQLSLLGNPFYNQMWDAMLPAKPPFQWLQDSGGIENVAFPARLGSLELRDDGLIGYFLPKVDNYSTFYACHYPQEMSVNDTYIKQIVQPPAHGSGAARYQGNIALNCQGQGVTVTMLMDPRGSVHTYTGILPVTRAALPAHIVEDFVKKLKVTFRTGPIIASPGTLRTPKPAEDQGSWLWIQPVPPPANWEQDQIVDSDDTARLTGTQPQVREGWLQLSDLKD